MLIMGSLTVAIVWMGLYPQPFLKTIEPVMKGLEQIMMVQ
jgi:NADH:ubiquinone oxidoreductase subunit 4 (subunit M)